MSFFNNYLHGLDDVLAGRTQFSHDLLSESRGFSPTINKGEKLEHFTGRPKPIDGTKVLFEYDPSVLHSYFGPNDSAFTAVAIGDHPDFKEDINFDQNLNHHCVSVFVDIKGSTRLIENHPLEEVRLIKDSLLTLAIHIANQFGGHIHRLQGDAIFMQFVRKYKNPKDAIINALNACSVLAMFVSIDLKSLFEERGLKPLKIRIGIDYGDDENVLLSHYGVPGCKELTTTSLHTDLAAKLQAKAPDNSILIGGNVKEELDLKRDFWEYFIDGNTTKRVYEISKTFSYPFFVFNWREYLNSFPFIGKASDGKSIQIKEKRINIACFIKNQDGSEYRYYPNSTAIPKGKSIRFKLMNGSTPYHKLPFENIDWQIYNSGKEAEDDKKLNPDIGKYYTDQTVCETSAAYLGHHYVECRIKRNHSQLEKLIFPVFVQ